MKSLLEVFVTAMILAIAMPTAARSGDGTASQSNAASATYKAAVQGSADAQAHLGALYLSGEGVPQSDAAAIQWLMRAAEQGHSKAQLMLADIWAIGRSVPRNASMAYHWAYLAKANATDGKIRDEAQQLLAVVARRMSAEEIADARQQADAWTPKREALPAVPSQPAAKTPASPPKAAKTHAGRRTEAPRSAASAAPRSQSTRRHFRSRLTLFPRRWVF